MLIKRAADIRSSEITDKQLYLNRRAFIAATAGAVAGAAFFSRAQSLLHAQTPAPHGRKLLNIKRAPSTTEKLNRWEEITTYNNYYEFGIDKGDPSQNARGWKTEPWTVTVDGECNKKAAWHLEDILKGEALEERIYRHRCVEAWSMVIPWIGFPLSDFIKKCEPTSKAKFVKFTTAYDPQHMPGVREQVLRWPYVEGLRMDEAMHPLTILVVGLYDEVLPPQDGAPLRLEILVVGLYDEVLPPQDGAPLRLAVPWKYGFKHIKSIVKVEFVEKQPANSWQISAPNEYGFYSNVNPMVDHPRWSQAMERRIGDGFFKRKTLLFNGYGDQVASLYSGMDLRKDF